MANDAPQISENLLRRSISFNI